MKKKLKPLLPSLKEKKRYLAFKILSESAIGSSGQVSKAIWDHSLGFLGELGCAEAGIILLQDKYNKGAQTGIIRVNHKHVDKMKSALMTIKSIEGKDVIVYTTGVSGILKKVAA